MNLFQNNILDRYRPLGDVDRATNRRVRRIRRKTCIPSTPKSNSFKLIEIHLFVIDFLGDFHDRGGLHGTDTALNGCKAGDLITAQTYPAPHRYEQQDPRGKTIPGRRHFPHIDESEGHV